MLACKKDNLCDSLIGLKNEKSLGIKFIVSGDKTIFLPYADLFLSAVKLGRYLARSGVKRGDEIVFQIPQEMDFVIAFWACLLNGFIAVPVSLSLSNVTKDKISKIIDKLNSPHVLSTRKHFTENLDFLNSSIKSTPILFDNTIDELFKCHLDIEAHIVDQKILSNDIAFIQFSSGSTGNPKGVKVTHANLITNLQDMKDAIEIGPDDQMISWMPLTHDMGLIGAHLLAVYCSLAHCIMPTQLFIRRPTLWLEKASEMGSTMLYSPNFGLRYLLKRVSHLKADTNLQKVRVIVNGAEPISYQLCKEFSHKLQSYKLPQNSIYPVYGLAECTLGVSFPVVGSPVECLRLNRQLLGIGCQIEEEQGSDAFIVVSVGSVIGDYQIKITDENATALEDGRIGIIRVKGGCVTSGYYNDSAETNKNLSPEGWLNTGDLGFIKEGNVYITGRYKDIIFINGLNYYSHDLEDIAIQLDELELNKIAISSYFDPDKGRDSIVAFILAKKGDYDFFEKVSEKLSEHVSKTLSLMIDYVVPIWHMPKTTSGKLQRYLLIKQFLDGDFNSILEDYSTFLTHKNETTSYNDDILLGNDVVAVFQDVIGTRNIDMSVSMFQLGVNSIDALGIVYKLNEQFYAGLTVSDIFQSKSIRSIVKKIGQQKGSDKKCDIIIQDLSRILEPFPLTDVQAAYLVGREDFLELGGVATHIYMEIKTQYDFFTLNEALNLIVARHPMLRAKITDLYEQAISTVLPKPVLANINMENNTKEEIDHVLLNHRSIMSHKRHDPATPGMFDFTLISGEVENTLCVSMDLLFVDASSIKLIGKELALLCSGQQLSLAPNISYRDYVCWLADRKKTDTYSRAKDYWMRKMVSFPVPPTLDYRCAPSVVVYPEFSRKSFRLNKAITNRFDRVCRNHNLTRSSMLCAIYAYVLGRAARQSNFCLTFTLQNRENIHPDILGVVGDFTSLFLIDVNLPAGQDILKHARDMQSKIFSALENSVFDGVEFLRELSKNTPEFSSSYVFTSVSDQRDEHGWSSIGSVDWVVSQTPQVIIDNQIYEFAGELFISWDYVKQLFEPLYIDELFNQYIDEILTMADLNHNEGGFLEDSDAASELSLSQKPKKITESLDK